MRPPASTWLHTRAANDGGMRQTKEKKLQRTIEHRAPGLRDDVHIIAEGATCCWDTAAVTDRLSKRRRARGGNALAVKRDFLERWQTPRLVGCAHEARLGVGTKPCMVRHRPLQARRRNWIAHTAMHRGPVQSVERMPKALGGSSGGFGEPCRDRRQVVVHVEGRYATTMMAGQSRG
jgi:hypothetical protein